ncbi:MAG: MFS transporter [Novosphingobium sp.]|nr:MFS transporter [Novosphingobium sp.]
MADDTDAWDRRRRLAALTIALAVTVSVFDGVMLNATLPSIAAQLHATPAEAIWVVNAYQLAAAAVLLPLGKAADIYGHKHAYLGCILVFGLASLGCALSQDLPTLAAWRFLQGCGGAGIMGITNAMIRIIYPEAQFVRGVALNSLLVAMGLAAGPTIASLLVTLAGWRWLFLVNLPIVAALLAVGWSALPAGKPTGHRFDFVSAALSMAMFGLLLLALDSGAHSTVVVLPAMLALGGIGAGALLLRRQAGMAMPLFPVDMLRIRLFGLSVATMFAASAAQLLAYVVLPFHFQVDLGRSQVETGLLFLPWPLALAVAAPLAARISDRLAAATQCAAGLGLFAIGLVLLALLERGAGFADIAWRMALCGFGYGLSQPANSRTLMTSAPQGRLGSASVMGASARVTGQACGAAVAALLFRLMPESGRMAALLVAAAFAALGVAFSLSRGPQSPFENARKSAF